MQKNMNAFWRCISTGLGFVLILGTVVSAQVPESELEQRDGLWYLRDSDRPYTGRVAGGDGPTGTLKDGKRVGKWVWAYENGQPRFELLYRDGTRLKGTGWHPNGKIESEMSFEDGLPNGPRRRWDENGHLRHERFYIGGKLDGKETIRDHNGAVLYTAHHKAGELDGEVIWWYPDGSPRWTTQYEAGVKTGTWSQWAPDGDLLMESTWKADRLIGRRNPRKGH